jgi:signal transduction protein with GAF and PtsI domain
VSDQIGTGTSVFEAGPVRGRWRRLSTPDDVIALLDDAVEDVVACVGDAGATFLAPIFDDLAAVVCLSGTPMSHIGIVSREYRVPCLMGVALAFEPDDDTTVEVDCSSDPGVVRKL